MATQRYRLMKLTFYDEEHNVTTVLPCPNCFLKSVNSLDNIICPGCIKQYSTGSMVCKSYETGSDEKSSNDCYCTTGRFSNGMSTCVYGWQLEEYANRNSAFYTADQVKALWPSIDFDNATIDQRVVGIDSIHNGKASPCCNCYGHHFPCGNCKDPNPVVLMSYNEYKHAHVACSRMPKTYAEYLTLTRRQIDRMIFDAWDEQANPEGKDA